MTGLLPGQIRNPDIVSGQSIKFPAGKTELNGYLARPSAPGKYAGLIIVHEASGLHDHIKDVARRLAALGYVVLAPDLYTRTGAPDPKDITSVMDKMFGLPDQQIVTDLEAAANHLNSLDATNKKTGCIGFCSGGRQTLLFACQSKVLSAAIDCWGGFITQADTDNVTTSNRPEPVIKQVNKLSCPLFAAFGEDDKNPSPTQAAQLDKYLKKYKKNGLIKVYPDSGHGFFADYRPSYQEKAAFALWADIKDFLERHL